MDKRCEVHQSVLGIREGKEGWFHLFCPGGIACEDEGDLFALMVSLLNNSRWALVSEILMII